MTFDLRPLVLEAVLRSDCPAAPILAAAHFAEVVQDVFGLRQCPAVGWACAVLDRLPYLTRASGATYRADLEMMGP